MNDGQEQAVDPEFEKENQKRIILDQINTIYESVLKPFCDGDKMIYDPDIFSKLKKEKFTEWVINNNNELSALFGSITD